LKPQAEIIIEKLLLWTQQTYAGGGVNQDHAISGITRGLSQGARASAEDQKILKTKS